MGLEKDIIRLLKEEGFRMNDTITTAVDELVELAQQENDEMELEDEEDEDSDDEEDFSDGFQTADAD